jgi:hypothetical protein
VNYQANGPATVSLGVGIGAIVLAMVSVCIGSVPVLNLVNLVVLPLQLVAAFAAIVSGIVGFRTSAALYGVGRGAATAGFALGMAAFGLRMMMWLFGF